MQRRKTKNYKLLDQKISSHTKQKNNPSNTKENIEKEKKDNGNSKDISINNSNNSIKININISVIKNEKQNNIIDKNIPSSDKDFSENKDQIKTCYNNGKDSSHYNQNTNKDDNNYTINENSYNRSIDINIKKVNGKESSKGFNSKNSSSNINDSSNLIISSISNSVRLSSCKSSLSSEVKKRYIHPLKIVSSQNFPRNNHNPNTESNNGESDYISSEKDYKPNHNNERELKTDSIKFNFIEEEKKNEISKKYTITIESLNIENNFFCCLWDYFKKREILFIAFLNEYNETPKFIKSSLLFFCLTTFLTINCLLFDESLLDKRYYNLLEGKNKKNGISYFFKNEFKISVYSALIGNTIKMLIIKIIIYGIFRLNKKEIKIMNAGKLNEKLKNKASKEYNINIKIYFFIIITTNLFIGYICICYGAVFENSNSFFILSFLVSYLLSILFCCFFCMVNILTYKIWRKTNSIIAILLFIVLNKLY